VTGDGELPPITILHDPWRLHPLAWIHRAEARVLASELKRAGHRSTLVAFRQDRLHNATDGLVLLRLSDPLMLLATDELERNGVAYRGPRSAVLERCYDKLEACRIAAASGVDVPETALASEPVPPGDTLIVKPRRGSDSIGVRVLSRRAIPARLRNDRYIVQEFVRGAELTVGIIGARAGAPLRVAVSEYEPYSFTHKYLRPRRRAPVADSALATRARELALDIARAFAVNWAARVDLRHESATGRLRFLECDAAPLVGASSAFAASLTAGGIPRAEQLRLLLGREKVSGTYL
jgi:D-alanine-D-alanine ligase-like ATP-grasp enzyme